MDWKMIGAAMLAVLFLGSAFAGDPGISNVSYDPVPASPGSTVLVWVQVKNDSVYDAENVVVKLDMDYPLFLVTGETNEKHIDVIKSRKSATVEYQIRIDPTAIDGDYSLKASVGEGTPIKQSSSFIKVLSRTPKLEIVDSSVSQLSPGQVESVLLTVKNIGGGIAKDIVLKVNPDRTVTSTGVVVEREITTVGATSNYIEDLEQDKSESVSLVLAVNQNAELKNYSVPVTMEYYDVNGTSRTQIGYLGIKVTADAEVDAVLNSVEPSAFPGGTSEIVVDLFNIGLADAKYVVVELSGNDVTIAEPKQFIGTLEADDFDSFNTDVTIAPTVQPGEMPLTLQVIYKDEELQEHVITKPLVVNVVSPGAASGGDLGILGIVASLVSLAIWLVGLYTIARRVWPRVKALRQRNQK